MKTRHKRRQKGFTLIEVMLVLVILVILASSVGFFVRGAQKKAMANAARSQIGRFKLCIEAFQLDIRSYPTTNQGLESLIVAPSDLRNPDNWGPRYLDSDQVPLDPWDNVYQYRLIDPDNYEIWSLGPDGADGTPDDIRSTDL